MMEFRKIIKKRYLLLEQAMRLLKIREVTFKNGIKFTVF